MAVNTNGYHQLKKTLGDNVTLVAVSKVRTPEEIMALYHLGQRDFGENYVQELIDKQALLPKDIRWHYIGHLQTNKVKFISPFVHLIQSVDSLKLLSEIDKQGKKSGRIIDCLLQVHIASEETKFGLQEDELDALLKDLSADGNADKMQNIRICGLMGMASFSDDKEKVRAEFRSLASLFKKCRSVNAKNISCFILSMGMSDDYGIAIEEGSNTVRVGSLLFGKRQ